MTRDAKKSRDMQARAVRKYNDRVMREVLAGERPYNSIPRVNRKRKAKLYARNFGDKADWIRAKPSCVSGHYGTRFDPMVASHATARGMGGCHGSLVDLVPMLWSENNDYSDLPNEKWDAKYAVTKAEVLFVAPIYHTEWLDSQEAA